VALGRPEFVSEEPAAESDVASPSPSAEPAPAPASPARIRWAVLLARICDVLPLLCPACGGDMKILAFLTDPPVVSAILRDVAACARHCPLSRLRAPCATAGSRSVSPFDRKRGECIMYSKVYSLTCTAGEGDSLMAHYDESVLPAVHDSEYHVGHQMIEVGDEQWILVSNYHSADAASAASDMVRSLVSVMADKFGFQLSIIGEGETIR
jgi:hypothetical protein